MDFLANISGVLYAPDYSNFVEKIELENTEKTEKEKTWLNQRKGNFTASEFVRLMGYEDKEAFPSGAITYVTEKVLEIVTTGDSKQLSSGPIEWGKENENAAVEKFAKKYNLEVYNYGDNQKFIKLGEHIGCTPDGLIGNDQGIETKCPDSKTHLGYLETLTVESFKKDCTKYYWQIQGSMYVTGRKGWFFVSYDPRFKNEDKRLFVLKIERNEADIAKLEKRLTEAIKLKKERLKDFE
ncbi:YqaJ viral recombinase family protein [Flavobacterium psychrophilum]|nr:YqaJ viral recombinase family protein [Flavobacterium psychrophilum]